jgi:hypothetical protein
MMRVGLGVLALSLLAGCSDGLVGDWESSNEVLCLSGAEPVSFTVDDDLRGDGGYCACNFTFVADNRGDDRYRVDVTFSGACLNMDGKYDCDLESNGERFDCGNLGDYRRVR